MSERRFIAFNEEGRVWESTDASNPYELDLSVLQAKGAKAITFYAGMIEVATLFFEY
jgi:hypothetical protein